MRIGITGINGLLGFHLHASLHEDSSIGVAGAERVFFDSDNALARFAESCDALVHFAGMNRGDNKVVADTNILLAKKLVRALDQSGSKPHLVFSSSTQIYKKTLYGASKIECARLFQQWADRTGSKFANLILPNVFGEGGKPFYNSVVSTFCHQVATGETPKIIQDSMTEQLHAGAVAREVLGILRTGRTGEVKLQGTPVTVTELLAWINRFADLYRRNIIPDLRNEFDLSLFNTYRSYLYPKQFPVTLALKTDSRGSLFEAVKSLNAGQTFISTTRPGITRGNHYHIHKVERFLVLRGSAEIRIRKLFSKEVLNFQVSGDRPQFVDIPTLHTHDITNRGQEELMTLFWAHEIYDPAKADTHPEKV